MRRYVTLLMFIGGVGLALFTYLFLAAPLGLATSPVYSNPRIVGAPILFVLGVILTFLSAVAYELIPDRVLAKERVPASSHVGQTSSHVGELVASAGGARERG